MDTTNKEEANKCCSVSKTDLISDKGYGVGKEIVDRHVFDEGLSLKLVDFFKKVEAQTIIDLGAGLGDYVKVLLKNGLDARGYDGNPASQTLSDGYVSVMDLTLPINLGKADWVLTLEVAEHLPPQYEEIFLNTVHKLNKKGVVLSWAVEGQGGFGHFNERNNDYAKKKMADLGYENDLAAEKFLREGRAGGIAPWFANTLMVFHKRENQ